MKKNIIIVLSIIALFLFAAPQSVAAESPQNEVTRMLEDFEKYQARQWNGGGQCYGFAKYTYQTVFGVTVTWSYSGEETSEYLYCVDSVTRSEDVAALYAKAMPGDILCWSAGSNNPHSTVVYDTSEPFTVLDANSDGANTIKINTTYSMEFMTNWLAAGRTTRISLFRLSPGNIALTNGDADLLVGQELQLTVETEVNTYVPQKWFSSNTNVATVDSNGYVKTFKAGTASIYCMIGNKVVSSVLTVDDRLTMEKSLDMEISTLFDNTDHQLVILANGQPLSSDNEVVWESTDDSVVMVDANGTVSAKNSGQAVVSAAFEHNGKDYVLTCVVNVA